MVRGEIQIFTNKIPEKVVRRAPLFAGLERFLSITKTKYRSDVNHSSGWRGIQIFTNKTFEKALHKALLFAGFKKFLT